MAKFQMKDTIDSDRFTARLGAGTGLANYVTDKEIGKAVKFVGDSRYDLCSAGDPIEGFIDAVETYTADDYSIGTVRSEDRMRVTLDGLQATPGTGTIAVGDYVVCGTVVAKGTALSGPVKVCKATLQIGATPATLAEAGTLIKASVFAWRVISLDGTGAVGQTATIERVNP